MTVFEKIIIIKKFINYIHIKLFVLQEPINFSNLFFFVYLHLLFEESLV